MGNILIEEWNNSSDLRDFLSRISHLKVDDLIDEFKSFLVNTYGDGFNYKQVLQEL